MNSENGLNKEIGLDYINEYSSHQLTFFTLKVKDWILWRQLDNGNWMPENLKEVKSDGIEWKSIFNFQFNQSNIYSEFNYQYNISINQKGISHLDFSVGKQLIYTPKHKANITTVLNFKDVYFTFNQSYVSSVFTSSDNLNLLPANYLINSSIKYKIKSLKSIISFMVNNVQNIEYQTYQSYPNPGREYIIKLNININ